ELVPRNLGVGHEAAVALDLGLARERVDDAVDVLGAEPVLGTVLPEAAAGVDHEHAFAPDGTRFVDDDDAGGDAGPVEEVLREADDALDEAAADELAADGGLGVATEEDAVGEDDGGSAGRFERGDDVEEERVVALLGRRDELDLLVADLEGEP